VKFFRKKPIRLEVVRREESKLRLADWQRDPQLCSLAAKVLANADLQLMLSVLKNEHPARIALRLGVPTDDRVVMQARSEGYEMFLSNLEAMGISRVPDEPIESAFEPV
jgi:hypothetical protein